MFSRTKLNPNMRLGSYDIVLTLWGKIAERIDYFKIRARYKYEVEAFTVRREADKWCDESCDGKWIYHYQPWIDYGPYYRFKKASDAMAFKLRWL